MLGLHVHPEVRARYRDAFPDDPAMISNRQIGHRFEIDNPATFTNMYQSGSGHAGRIAALAFTIRRTRSRLPGPADPHVVARAHANHVGAADVLDRQHPAAAEVDDVPHRIAAIECCRRRCRAAGSRCDRRGCDDDLFGPDCRRAPDRRP